MAKRLEQGSLRELLGKEVRRRRTEAGLTQQQLGNIIHVVDSRIAQIETATGAKVTYDLCAALDAALGTGGLLSELYEHLRKETLPDWVRRFLDLQARARVIHEFSQIIPGLVQTEAYVRALFESGRVYANGDLEEKLAFRLGRQEILKAPNPPWLWIVLDESALYREVGGPEVMNEQLARLLELGEHPRVDVQVLPFNSRELAAIGSNLSLVTLPNGEKVAYTEGILAGLIFEDLEDVTRFTVIYDRLRANALPPAESAALIRKVMEERYSCPPSDLI
ncbi:helix-turn-helix domain-containing protein [Streptomyces silvisoli]|uniref:Helix-turn-helix transcriptional regulator n=1 Tax=Streptomyces silvisoli TaxID=3034235 RepID=A0ABT5ZMU6_9ACTN|nr:helix-turn-helix transcriptional regulator [Streptomyces silvisoli]MDF3291152.1 helix-turn-helix transcriptional regulator [Streptomyces silvisoli]